MSHYFKIIKGDAGYQFVMIPNNNNGQPMGYSDVFQSHEECMEAFANFKSFVKNEMTEENKQVEVNDNKGKQYKIVDNNGVTLFSNRYGSGSEPKNSMDSVIRHIDAPLK